MTDAAVRAFAARQEAAWNARDLRAFSASFLPDARFIEQARASDNQIVQTGVADLAQAIAAGISRLESHDILIIAGKGHEPGQIIGDKTLPFDDAEEARKVLAR